MDKRTALAALLVISLAVATAGQGTSPEYIDCEGPEGTFRVTRAVPCSEIVAPDARAQAFVDSLVVDQPNLTKEALAASLRQEIANVCNSEIAPGTVGELYGVGRWGCENGYRYFNLCQGFYLEKRVPEEYGYTVVYRVILSSYGVGGIAVFDTASAIQWKSFAEDVDIVVAIGLEFISRAGTAPPADYASGLRSEHEGEAAAILRDILSFAAAYKTEYCDALHALGNGSLIDDTALENSESVEIIAQVSAEGYLPSSRDLGLSSQDVSLISMTGAVKDDEGNPVEGAVIRFAGWDVSTTTDREGEFRLSAFGSGATPVTKRIDFTVQRVYLDVVAPLRLDGAGTYTGVVADGRSALRFEITTRGIQPETVKLDPPNLGRFVTPVAGPTPLLDQNGAGILEYIPPDYIESRALTETLSVGTEEEDRVVWATRVPLRFSYVDVEGNAGSHEVEILVCRPPLLAVQGLPDPPEMWTVFTEWARGEKFDVVVGDALSSESPGGTIDGQAEILKSVIDDQIAEYASWGIKLSRVDVLAHGFGGLAARRLTESSEAPSSVRKLIMLATPHHGLSLIDQRIGAMLAGWFDRHPEAAEEIRAGSDFLNRLNAGESEGLHLNPNVQYANLIGRRTSVLVSPQLGLVAMEDDGIVRVGSAHQSGVAEFVFDGTSHAPSLPLPDVAITESPDVWARVSALLMSDITRVPLDGVAFDVRRGRLIEYQNAALEEAWTAPERFPAAVAADTRIRTQEGGYAIVGLYLSGKLWGTISIDENSVVTIRSSSPEWISIEMERGGVRFRGETTAEAASHFHVLAAPARDDKPWYQIQSRARILGLETDFVSLYDGTATIYAIDGRLVVESHAAMGDPESRFVETNQGLRVLGNGMVEAASVPGRGWWSNALWIEPRPGFIFPWWILPIVGALLTAAVLLHLRARRQFAAWREAHPKTHTEEP